MRRFLLSSTLCLAALSVGIIADGQVVVDQLNAAQQYDSEPLNPSNGGLDPALWQGVTASQASVALEAVDYDALSELPYMFMRRVLLSAGVPPQGDNAARAEYLAVKTQAKLQLQDYTALNSLSNPQNPQQRQAQFRAKLALASGDIAAACDESDREIDKRGAAFWMEMRIICHIIRNEGPAAELTLNLMRSRDDASSDFVALADTALGLRKAAPKKISQNTATTTALQTLINKDAAITVNDNLALAVDVQRDPNARLEAMFKTKNRLTVAQVKSIFSSFILTNDGLAGGVNFDIDTALDGLNDDKIRAKSAGQLFAMSMDYGNPQELGRAVAALLKLSGDAGYGPQMMRVLSDALPFISYEDQAQLDALGFSWAAIRRSDLSALRGLYQALDPNDPLRGRIALASDALGNGFLLGELGLDIETRLLADEAAQDDARRDALIGLALGARMSDAASTAFHAYNGRDSINPLHLAQINSAAAANARAALLIEIAKSIGGRELSELSKLEIYSYIKALSTAGLPREAGELAAYDFMSRITDNPNSE